MNPEARKQVLRKIPYGVYIVGAVEGDDFNGFTATWLSQCSFDPPLLMVAVRAESRSRAMIKTSGVFTVNYLDKSQQKIAQHFFRPVRRVGSKLGEVEFRTGVTGAPILSTALAYAECRVVDILEKGDHHVVIGEVLEAEMCREGEALILSDTGWSYGG